ESREQVEENLERWRFALERRGMKVSRSKTEYMCVNEREGSGTVRLQGEEVKKVQEFKYLGSTVQSNGECGKETVDLTEAYGQRMAVYAITHAIKKLLKCDDTSCSKDTNFLPWKLISILRNMKFTVDDQTYYFNKDGDFENGYDLIMWKKNGDERILDVVGQYLISNNNVNVYDLMV
ncbi:hypothetical protein QTP86_021466, partial [Hemibagrus guttatus]